MILLVGNIKGGVGKSALACNIAAALSLADPDGAVLLIDGDKQGSAADFTQGRIETRGEAGFTCIRAQGAEVISHVKTMRGKFRYIIIDAGGQDNPSLRAGLALADKVLVPVPPRSAELWALSSMADLIEEARLSNPRLEAFAVLNFGVADSSHDNEDTAAAIREDHAGLHLLDTVIVNRKAWSSAFGQGLSVLEIRPRNLEAISEFLEVLAGLSYIDNDDMKVIYDGRTKKA